jgi:quinol monooxygenase YgiN
MSQENGEQGWHESRSCDNGAAKRAKRTRGDMSGALIYVDTSEVREGAVEELREAIKELVEFIDANEPQIVAYSVYLSDDGRQMTVVHVHADAASLEYHMDVAGPAFRKLADLITLSSIRVYGEPSEKAIRQLHDKARSLGRDDLVVHGLEAGFSRIGSLRLSSRTV